MGLGILIQPNPDTTVADTWACCNMNEYGFCEVMTTMAISQDEMVSTGVQTNYDYWVDYTGQGIADPTAGQIYQLDNPSGYPFLFTPYAGVIVNQNGDPTALDQWAAIIIDAWGNATVTAQLRGSYNDLVAGIGALYQGLADYWVDYTVSGQNANVGDVYDITASTFTTGVADPTVLAALINLHTALLTATAAYNAAEPNRSYMAVNAAWGAISDGSGPTFLNSNEQTLWTSATEWVQAGGT